MLYFGLSVVLLSIVMRRYVSLVSIGLEKVCEEKKGDNNMTKEELLMKENEELNKRIELLEKAVEIKDKKIEYLQAMVNTMAEQMEEIMTHTSGYMSQLEETIGDLI